MRLSPPTLVFVRHGRTDWNVDGRLLGQQDVPLNEAGRADARHNGATIKAAVPEVATFDFVASPLSRARETMEIVREAIGLDRNGYRTDATLREITFGRWEGRTLDDIRAGSPDEIAARERDKWGFRHPGGESYVQLAERLTPWLARLTRPTVIVAHGGTGRVLWIELTGMDPGQAAANDFPHDKVLLWKDGAASLL